MKFISHRGNLIGPDSNRENSPSYIHEAVDAGYDVEVDVWCLDHRFFLGHDQPQYEVTSDWLMNLPLWCHAKNQDAFSEMLALNIHCFWHETDRFTLTSRGIPWCFPDNYIDSGVTVIKHAPQENGLYENVFGICTDHPIEWRNKWNSNH